MQAYRGGAPPNFRVDPPSIVTHMYVRTIEGGSTHVRTNGAGNVINFV